VTKVNAPTDGANGASSSAPAFRAITVRGAWKLAAFLFIAGTLSTIPGTLLLEEEFETWMYSLTVLGVLSGVFCLVASWTRISARWLAAVPIVATIEVAVVVGISHVVFTYLYFFVSLYVALVFPTYRRMAPFLVFIVLALFAPFLYEDEPARTTLLWALAVAPGIILIPAVIGRLTTNLEQSREAYRRLSSEDALTGVGNYRSLIERLRHETARHQRRGREFAILTLDLNDFKMVNETQGHLVGDMLLAIVGSMIDLKVRTEDAVFRQGGDEFSVIAPETGRAQADQLADRIEEGLARISSGPVQLSASVGTAIFPHDGTDPGELLDAADAALIYRKRNDPSRQGWGQQPYQQQDVYSPPAEYQSPGIRHPQQNPYGEDAGPPRWSHGALTRR
jgi:diguanylate cyclase (GGDEF)-like protein